jgi:hypothetical protein
VRLVGLNAAVAPVGRPEALKLTAVAYPPSIVRVTVEVAVPPGGPESVDGEAESVKPWVWTVSVTAAVWTRLPLVAVTVSGYEPATNPEVVETVIVVEPEPVTEAGLKPALAFAGRPATVKVAAPVSPVDAVTVTVKFVLPPGITVPVLGVAARLKSGVTVKVAAVVCWSEPFVPVIVNGKTPAATDAVVAMVSVVVPVEVRVVGLKVAVAPDGNPEVPNVTVEL